MYPAIPAIAIAEAPARILRVQRDAFNASRFPDAQGRRDRLRRLSQIVTAHEAAFVAAMDQDFGHRSAHETRLAEFYFVARGIASREIRRVARWMHPRRVTTPLHFPPASSRIVRQPLGVAGVIGPWNYPVQLALGPLAALAAGNRVLLKPSELTPKTSALLAQLVAAHFREEDFAVVQGGAAVGEAFVALPFDHLLFTGSTAVGRKIAWAAAANLTPVTLELGGKSPALVDADPDVATAASRGRQAAQRGTDLHRARLRAGSEDAARCVRRSDVGRRARALLRRRRQRRLLVDHRSATLRAARRAGRGCARGGCAQSFRLATRSSATS